MLSTTEEQTCLSLILSVLGTIDVTTPWDLTASSPDDFTPEDVQVDFIADQETATVDIAIQGDIDIEGHEQFIVYLYDPDTAEALGDLNKAIITIYDNDLPGKFGETS